MNFKDMTYMDILKVRNQADDALTEYQNREKIKAYKYACPEEGEEKYFADAISAFQYLAECFEALSTDDFDSFNDFNVSITTIYLTQSEFTKWVQA